jgi:hypothetical protein
MVQNNLLSENFSGSNYSRKKDFISLHLEWNGLVVKIFFFAPLDMNSTPMV